MFLCWSAKGGSGTTVVAAALALVLSRRRATTIVDLAGDQPAALGIAEPAGPGVFDWMASPHAEAVALEKLFVPVCDNLHLLPRGTPNEEVPSSAERYSEFVSALTPRCTVIDAGTGQPAANLVAAASQVLLVTRPCYLSLRRAVAAGVQSSGIVLVGEPGRALTARDIERAVGAPVVAELHYDPAVARSVDAGLLAARLPRTLAHALANLQLVDA